MARPPETRSIRKDSLPGAPGWVDALLRQLNGFMSQVGDALAGNLTTANLSGRYVRLAVTGGSQPKAFPVDLAGRKATCVTVAQVEASSADVTSAPGVLWAPCTTKDGSGLDVPGVQVTKAFGLATGKPATFTLLVLAE